MLYGHKGNTGSDPYADAAPAEPTEKPTAEPEEERGEEATAVIPKALLAGKDLKPGDEFKLEIVQMNEDGAVVKPCSYKENEEYSEEPVEEQAAAPTTAGGNSMYE